MDMNLVIICLLTFIIHLRVEANLIQPVPHSRLADFRCLLFSASLGIE